MNRFVPLALGTVLGVGALLAAGAAEARPVIVVAPWVAYPALMPAPLLVAPYAHWRHGYWRHGRYWR